MPGLEAVPPHIPQSLVLDLDILNLPGGDVDPQGAWRSFKGKGPLVYTPRNGGHWVITSGKAVAQFFRDPTIFSSASATVPETHVDVMLPVQADPPVHGKYRANMQALLTRERVGELESRVREVTIELIDALAGKGECEFVSEFALNLPLIIFLEMVGLPTEDRFELGTYVKAFLTSGEAQGKIDAHASIHRYLERWVDLRRRQPAEDGLSHIVHARIDGRPYTDHEIYSNLTLLMQAGLDTVAMMLAFIALHLANHPADRDYIRNNPAHRHRIIQELFRRFGGPNLVRKLTRDYTYEGVTMKEGELIVLSPVFFNQDEETLSNPDEIDFTRDARHITFGAGPHVCIGAELARREVSIFLDEWLTRIPDFSVDPARPPKLGTSQQNSVHALWLKWPTA